MTIYHWKIGTEFDKNEVGISPSVKNDICAFAKQFNGNKNIIWTRKAIKINIKTGFLRYNKDMLTTRDNSIKNAIRNIQTFKHLSTMYSFPNNWSFVFPSTRLLPNDFKWNSHTHSNTTDSVSKELHHIWSTQVWVTKAWTSAYISM